ncbi:alanine--tRNA ligase [bacterium SCSIO 12741]|nr:alanine--tRNA ligase [bacterium SCSIO 12741]
MSAKVKNWDVNRIRKAFLEYFEGKGHKVVPSAPVVIKNDPTLLFTNAGMNQFKDVFLGNDNRAEKRVADAQKCLRASGKHNDLEEVGVDTYHHTLFEMLGNWSFGDYFKKEAIDMAWELLTQVYGIDPADLYITIFEGDKKDGTQADEEAREYWLNHLPADRILEFDKKDNFWEMGKTGPCGPCSEIHIDIRSEEEKKQQDARELVNMDHPQVIEIWNLVFIQYNRMADEKLVPLPSKHIDTGMGLERLAMVLQGKQSNYDTDVFSGLIGHLESLSGRSYASSEGKEEVAFRAISDHIRAVAFTIADGQLPSNNKAGYVIRRILRRAVRYGYSFLNLKEPFMYTLIPVLSEQMGESYPELRSQEQFIAQVIREEEEGFLRTLDKGIDRLQKILQNGNQVDGKSAFELYDTFGFPIDLTELIASEENASVDREGYEVELEKQKNRSRERNLLETDDWVELTGESTTGQFLGYDQLQADVQIQKYRKVNQKGKEFYQLVLDQTPFYPEGGGQVGDKGTLVFGDQTIAVFDTKKENDLIVHFTKELPADASLSGRATVYSGPRQDTASNHSATHLLHHVLRKHLGNHVEQKGSMVNKDYLRFDFSHFQKVSEEELATIEKEVNEWIDARVPLDERRSVPLAEAKGMGAMSLFGEKYGEEVRVIKFGDSIELCGGTHVGNTGDIKYFKITGESSISAGVRRIEAVTGQGAMALLEQKETTLDELMALLGNPKDIKASVSQLMEDKNKLEKKLAQFDEARKAELVQSLKNNAVSKDGMAIMSAVTDLDTKKVRDICFQLQKEVDGAVVVIGSKMADKAGLSVLIDKGLVEEKSLNAIQMIKEVSSLIRGGGGGQPFFATAGGKEPAGVDQAVEQIVSSL